MSVSIKSLLLVVLSLSVAGVAHGADEKKKKKKDDGPTEFERLVELNGQKLFGTDVKVKKGRFSAVFNEAGAFGRGFDLLSPKAGTGVISDVDLVKSVSVRRVLIDGAKGKFSFLGLKNGRAVSNFRLEDDYRVSFRLRMPTASKSSRITWYLNREDKSNYLRVVNLNDLGRISAGGKARARATASGFRGVLGSWFDRKSKGVLVEFHFKNGQATVRVETAGGKPELTEVVTLEGIDSPRGGKLALAFEGVSFLVTDFRIDGRLPEAWLKSKIESLRSSGELKSPKKQDKADPKKGDEKGDAKEPTKKKGPDLDKDDPESDIDL